MPIPQVEFPFECAFPTPPGQRTQGTFNTATRLVTFGPTTIVLPPRCAAVLHLLLRRAPQVVGHDDLADAEGERKERNTVHQIIKAIRTLLKWPEAGPIVNHRSCGYSLEVKVDRTHTLVVAMAIDGSSPSEEAALLCGLIHDELSALKLAVIDAFATAPWFQGPKTMPIQTAVRKAAVRFHADRFLTISMRFGEALRVELRTASGDLVGRPWDVAPAEIRRCTIQARIRDIAAAANLGI